MKWLYAVVVLLALGATPRGASAQPTSKPDAAADAAGRQHFQRGQKLSARGEFDAAYREFEAGYAVTHRPLFLFNMAEAARAGGEDAKARANYLEFLRLEPNSALAATARARLADLEGAAAPPPPPPVAPPPVPRSPPSATPAHPDGAPLPPGPVAHAEGRPAWKKWPFWAVVAGGVVASGAVVYVVTRDHDLCGAGCSEYNFR